MTSAERENKRNNLINAIKGNDIAERSYVRMAESNNRISPNKIPVSCSKCGRSLFTSSGQGEYLCGECGNIEYDSFKTIKNLLAEEGPLCIDVIAEKTGFSRELVKEYIKEERLEVSLNSPVMLRCSGCGDVIRTGVLCEKCKRIAPRNTTSNLGVAKFHTTLR